jgi:hypothetical protein
MADRLAQGAAWLEDQRLKHLASLATYRRESQSVSVLVTPASTGTEQSDSTGALIDSAVRDYLIAVDALVLGGQRTEPAIGDVIEMTLHGRTQRHEVTQVGEEIWRFSDPYNRRYRIYTRYVGDVT